MGKAAMHHPNRQHTVGEVLDLLAAFRSAESERRQPRRDRRALATRWSETQHERKLKMEGSP